MRRQEETVGKKVPSGKEAQKPQKGYVDNNVLADECENDPLSKP